MSRHWYSIKGSGQDGWTLMVYQYNTEERDGALVEREDVSPAWPKPREFADLSELLQVVISYEGTISL